MGCVWRRRVARYSREVTLVSVSIAARNSEDGLTLTVEAAAQPD